jgi:RNase P subunit RPR2
MMCWVIVVNVRMKYSMTTNKQTICRDNFCDKYKQETIFTRFFADTKNIIVMACKSCGFSRITDVYRYYKELLNGTF